jgi:hypothetical protein
MPYKFTPGWKRQPIDHRDFYYKVAHWFINTLGPTVDLSGNVGPYLDQSSLGSCGPNTASECIDYDEKVENLPVNVPSRLFTYYNTRLIMGTVGQDSGVDNRSMMKALNQYGFCPETLWPYDVNQFTVAPPQNCYSAALPNSITNYAAVMQSLDQMKGCIASLFPFIFGFTVFPSMLTDAVAATGIIPMPGPTETEAGGHDMTLCGYTDVDVPGVKPGNTWPAGTFKLRQHWVNNDGSPWGDSGYGYLPFNYGINVNLAGDFWVINAIPGGSPAPTPTPTPPTPTPQPPTPVPTPPTPTPTPPGPSPGQQQFDKLLDRLIARFHNRRRIDEILVFVKQYGDAWFAKNLGKSIPLRQLLDLAFTAAEGAFPAEASLIAMIQMFVDGMLPPGS